MIYVQWSIRPATANNIAALRDGHNARLEVRSGVSEMANRYTANEGFMECVLDQTSGRLIHAMGVVETYGVMLINTTSAGTQVGPTYRGFAQVVQSSSQYRSIILWRYELGLIAPCVFAVTKLNRALIHV